MKGKGESRGGVYEVKMGVKRVGLVACQCRRIEGKGEVQTNNTKFKTRRKVNKKPKGGKGGGHYKDGGTHHVVLYAIFCYYFSSLFFILLLARFRVNIVLFLLFFDFFLLL